MLKKLKIATALLMLLLYLTIHINAKQVFAEGQTKELEGIMAFNSLYVPIRAVLETFGAEVTYEHPYVIKITYNEKIIKTRKGITRGTINDVSVKIDPPVISNSSGDTTYIPIRFISEQLGAKVEWNSKTEQATIITDKGTVIVKKSKTKLIDDHVQKIIEKSKKDANELGFPVSFIGNGINISFSKESPTGNYGDDWLFNSIDFQLDNLSSKKEFVGGATLGVVTPESILLAQKVFNNAGIPVNDKFLKAFDGLKINDFKDYMLGRLSWEELGTKTLIFGNYKFKIFKVEADNTIQAEIYIETL